ncbi:right-handed parallel beta-helix repeat-containing protein [Candidatus Sumerlaeota bacterium]|nr:right-handed parallel beta-helix repeat-containing protein [Candidatus Sumerlaeota bacterium]
MKNSIFAGLFLFSIISIDPAFSDFESFDIGTTYTLTYLASLSSGAIESTTEGFVLKEKVTISPSDTLTAENDTLLINPQDEFNNPTLIIKGRLCAFNMRFRTNSDPPLNGQSGNQIYVTGYCHDGMAEAVLTSCTLQNLFIGISASHGGKVDIDRCFFQNCPCAGLFLHSQGKSEAKDSFFDHAGVVVNSSLINLHHCTLKSVGMNVTDLLEGSSISHCDISQCMDSGIYIREGARGEIRDNEIHDCSYGVVIASNASLTLQGNIIRDNLDGGLFVTEKAIPKIRQNAFQRNALNPPRNDGNLALPAIYIDLDSQPNLGWRSDPGNNIFMDSGVIYLYYTGQKTIYAFGNDWGKPNDAEIEYVIYHRPDDLEDADGSGILSGWVILNDVISIPQSREFVLY